MKKDFKFILFACMAAVILSVFTLTFQLIPREKLFAEDNPNKDTAVTEVLEESEVVSDGLE